MTPELYWLAALRLPKIGIIKFRKLLTHFASIEAVFAATTAELKALNLSAAEIHSLQNPSWEAAKRDLEWAEKTGTHIILPIDARYPTLLLEVHDAPLLLFVRGDVDLLAQPQLAIVGSRNPSPGGREIAAQFAESISRAGLVITSGLALGIDAASHQGALKAQGPTIAVLGTGLNYIYPPSNKGLAGRILSQGGALVSEFHPEVAPIAHHFPRRNRIISGLSLGVLVIEAAIRSGSLITAHLAIEQGREVFAVPGSIHNPLARGCHALIRQGAKLIEKSEEILEELGALHAVQSVGVQKATQGGLKPEQQALLEQIGYEVTPLDTIIHRSGLTAGQLSSMLLALELQNYVYVVPGGYVRTP